MNALQKKAFSWHFCAGVSPDPIAALNQVETRLKANREANTGLRLNHPAKQRTPLGYSDPELGRQASAIYFRPVGFLTKNGAEQFGLMIFQAPDQVLCEEVLTAYQGKTRLDLT